MSAQGTDKAIVLVHGGFVDGSGWEGVYKILKADGYDVAIVQNPTTSLQADVAATKAVIAAQTKPVIACRPFLRRRRDHGIRHRSEGGWSCVHHGVRAG